MLIAQPSFLMLLSQEIFPTAERRAVRGQWGSRGIIECLCFLSRSLSMSISHKQPATIPAVLAPQQAWHRWMPVWYGVFYVVLLFTTLFSQRKEAHASGPLVVLLGLSALLGIWYGFCIPTSFSQYMRSHALVSTGYLLIGWGIWFGLILLDPTYMFLLFGLYPQIFVLRPVPWNIIDAIILTILTLWRRVTSLESVNSDTLFIIAATIAGILFALFIDAIIRQSRERQRLISELEQARQELAIAERQAGVTEERQRLAHEIHDTLIQGFTSVVMHLEAADGALSEDVTLVQRHLDQARRTARENLAEARRLLWAL